MKKKGRQHDGAHGGGDLELDALEDKAKEDAWARADAAGPRSSQKKAAKPAKRYRYVDELVRLQFELIKLQDWVQKEGLKVVVIFEGRDAAGKGGVIKRITESLNPRVCRVVALGTPTERERGQWYFQRYVAHLPARGEIVLFDRSWYNRAGVERVMGFCSDDEYHEFLRACPLFEEMLVRSGIILIKYWFSVSDEEQERRFKERIENPIKRWKLSPMDLKSRERWVDYSRAKDVMLKHTDTDAVALARGRRGQQEEGPAQLHRPPAVADPLQGDQARRRSSWRRDSRTTATSVRPSPASAGSRRSTSTSAPRI